MSTPRSRPKSHLGCLPCKKRKIKCDEGRPQCKRCIKRGVDCQYQVLPVRSYDSASVSTQETASRSTELGDSTHSSKDRGTPHVFQDTPSPAQTSLQDYSKDDFELLHHYTTSTCLTFAMTPVLENLWSKTVPQEAFAHDFLLHGILALSAFHLSYLLAERKAHYGSLAKQHYSLSISSFRKELQDPSSEAGGALLAFSIIAVVATFANSSTVISPVEGRANGALDDLIGVAALQRGVPAIVGAMQGSVRQKGILTPIVEAWMTPAADFELPDGVQSALQRLEETCRGASPDGTEGYSAAIDHLRTAFRRALTKGSRLLALEWFISLSDGFISAAKAHDRAAVTILAHFGVILHYCRDFWWVGDEGKKIVEEAAEVLGDECDWADWARIEVDN
ncbi:MAG: hypothetical protein M1812_000585 [Candelaria pacifica]|nr:MAG: hypothetical protein M1812_000585 [Candelaria pacifica]